MFFAGKEANMKEAEDCERRGDTPRPCREWGTEYLRHQIMGLNYAHCYESERDGFLDSKYVAVIHANNTVGFMLEKEITRLSQYQKQIYDGKLEQYIKDWGHVYDTKKMKPNQRI